MIFALVGDLADVLTALPAGHPRHRLLRLLEEAVRRDVHFIGRHPTALFQCLWNTCWWYDAPEAGRHFADGQAPGAAAGVGLHAWLDRCRQARDRPGAPWLRALRPPPVALGQALLQVLRGHASDVTCVACAPDGRAIASGGWDQTVRVWDAGSGEERATLRGHQGPVTGVAFSPDGRRVVSGSADRGVRLWDAATGAGLAVLTGHGDEVTGVAFAPDGRAVASRSAGDDRSVRVWDADRGAETAAWPDYDGPTCVAFSPDGRRLATGSEVGALHIWDAANGEELANLYEHLGGITAVAFSPDGRRIVTGSRDNTVRLWDADSGAVLGERRVTAEEPRRYVDQTPDHWVTGVAFAPDGRRVAVAASDKVVWLWDPAAGAEPAALPGHREQVLGVAFLPGGRRVVSASSDGAVHVWDADAAGGAAALMGHADRVTAVDFYFGGQLFVTGSMDKTVRVWDPATGAQTCALAGHTSPVWHVAASPVGPRVVSASSDSTVRVWNPGARAELRALRDLGEASVAFAPDGRRAASGSRSGLIRVWDVETGAVALDIRGHAGEPTGAAENPFAESRHEVRCLAFSPDGRRLASGSADRTVRVWDAATGAELAVLGGHEGRVSGVAFSPDGRRVVSGVYNQAVRVWDAATGACLEVIPGTADVLAVAGGPERFPWRLFARGQEVAVEAADGGGCAAWLPEPLWPFAPHRSGRLWAGAGGGHVYVLALEGAGGEARP